MEARRCLALLAVLVCGSVAGATRGEERFSDDFSEGLSAWRLVGARGISIVDSGDPEYGSVLSLEPHGAVHALVEGSDGWGDVRVEAEILFPTTGHSYLGMIYNYTDEAERIDFGSLYIKGNGNYIRANPWRDGNVSRLLYEEYRTVLTGSGAIESGVWQRVMIEVSGSECHLYVGDMTRPAITFDLFEGASGLVGFKPRVVGEPVWVDNVRISSIAGLTWEGSAIPELEYSPHELLTQWEVHGPLERPDPAVEGGGGEPVSWLPFETDRRGAVVTGRVTEFAGARSVAYFRTSIVSPSEREAVLHFSTTDEIALWVNDEFRGYVYRDGYISPDNDWNAWYDFWSDPAHAGSRVPVDLDEGVNQVVVRVRNGQFAVGGFFARLEKAEE